MSCFVSNTGWPKSLTNPKLLLGQSYTLVGTTNGVNAPISAICISTDNGSGNAIMISKGIRKVTSIGSYYLSLTWFGDWNTAGAVSGLEDATSDHENTYASTLKVCGVTNRATFIQQAFNAALTDFSSAGVIVRVSGAYRYYTTYNGGWIDGIPNGNNMNGVSAPGFLLDLSKIEIGIDNQLVLK